MFVYQSIDLPGEETLVGQWDHRATTDVYLAHTNFLGKTVLDVGPGNGFWSFEMERRGATVTAVELGDSDEWDMVPHGGVPPRQDSEARAAATVELREAFTYCHTKLNSKVRCVNGSIYNVPNLVRRSDIALLGNILQHLRDPLLAIERVAQTVTERIIISETIWVDDAAFLETPRMHFFPRASVPEANHSWYQLSPALVTEWLNILGFPKQNVEIHEQKFLGTPSDPAARMVKHFTCSGDRT